MRLTLCATILLFATPVFAADAQTAGPPSPPAVTYQVWGFKWDGNQYVKQPAYCLSTPNAVQASPYANQVNAVPGWCATYNCPPAARFASHHFGAMPYGFGKLFGDWQHLMNSGN